MPSFLDMFTGRAAQRQLQQANQQAQGYMREGYGQARDAIGQGYTDARGYINPLFQSGRQANDLYANYLGVNGQPAQQQAYAGFQTSPGYQALLNERMRGLDRRANAGGGYYSGNALRAAGDAHQSMMSGEFDRYLGRLGGYAGQGSAMAQYGAGLASNYGQQMAGLHSGYASGMAGNAINYGNAMAQAANIPMQNMLGLGGMVLSGMNAYNAMGRVR